MKGPIEETSMRLRYFRHINKELSFCNTNGVSVSVNCLDLTPIDRLILSAYLTNLENKVKDPKDKSTLAQTVFNWSTTKIYTPANFKDFDEAVTKCLEKYVPLLHWIQDNWDKKENNKQVIFSNWIDTDKIFVTSGNGNQLAGKSLSAIAWKAFVLSAVKASKTTNPVMKKISIFNWIDGTKTSTLAVGSSEYAFDAVKLEKYKHNRTQTRRIIDRWLDKVGIEGEYKEDCFINPHYVYSSTKDNSIQNPQSSSTLNEGDMEFLKSI